MLRRDRLGFVFQAFNLLPTLTAEENITLPADLAGRKLDRGLDGHRGVHAQARRPAAATAPPSSPAASSSASPSPAPSSRARRWSSVTSRPAPWTPRPAPSCSTFLRTAVDELRQTVVMVTHDPVAASYADRVIFLVDGAVVEELAAPTRDDVLETMKRLGD